MLKIKDLEPGLILELEGNYFKIIMIVEFLSVVMLLRYPCEKSDEEIGNEMYDLPRHISWLFDYSDFIMNFGDTEINKGYEIPTEKIFTPDGFELYFNHYIDKLSYNIRHGI